MFVYLIASSFVFLIRYVEEDLKKGLGKEPAQVLSARPMVSYFKHSGSYLC